MTDNKPTDKESQEIATVIQGIILSRFVAWLLPVASVVIISLVGWQINLSIEGNKKQAVMTEQISGIKNQMSGFKDQMSKMATLDQLAHFVSVLEEVKNGQAAIKATQDDIKTNQVRLETELTEIRTRVIELEKRRQ